MARAASGSPDEYPEEIGARAAQLGVGLGPEQIRQLAEFSRLLIKWNAVHNLTAIRALDQIATRHLLDSLAIVPQLRLLCARPAARLLDVGAGGGLPGIPIAVACPDLRLTLLDSVRKKCAFLTQARLELRLGNVEVVCARIERWRAPRFDVIVSRAFASVRDFVQLTQHLLRADGIWMAMKGPAAEEETRDLPPGVEVAGVVPMIVPELSETRNLVVLRLRPGVAEDPHRTMRQET